MNMFDDEYLNDPERLELQGKLDEIRELLKYEGGNVNVLKARIKEVLDR